jgi:hypothetical protein
LAGLPPALRHELGVLEGRGNLMNIRKSEVRLRDHAPWDGAGSA